LYGATVIDDAIRFASCKSQDKEKTKLAVEGDKEESKEPDYDENRDQLEEKQGYNQSEISRILHKPAYHEKVYVEQFPSSIEIFW
jgi:hypothetical protein